MAAPSLQDVLAVVPAAEIDVNNELIPGVQASKQNLHTLLEHIMSDGGFFLAVRKAETSLASRLGRGGVSRFCLTSSAHSKPGKIQVIGPSWHSRK